VTLRKKKTLEILKGRIWLCLWRTRISKRTRACGKADCWINL